MATTATAAGIGKGTETAWNDGAGLLEGLGVGTLTGLWEGVQFYIGGKIGNMNIFGPGGKGFLSSIGSGGVGTKLLNSLSRVVLDGVDGGVEGFETIREGIYRDEIQYSFRISKLETRI